MGQSSSYYCHLLVHEVHWRLQTQKKTSIYDHAQFRITFCPGITVPLVSSSQSLFKLQWNQVSLPMHSEVVQLCLHLQDKESSHCWALISSLKYFWYTFSTNLEITCRTETCTIFQTAKLWCVLALKKKMLFMPTQFKSDYSSEIMGQLI